MPLGLKDFMPRPAQPLHRADPTAVNFDPAAPGVATHSGPEAAMQPDIPSTHKLFGTDSEGPVASTECQLSDMDGENPSSGYPMGS